MATRREKSLRSILGSQIRRHREDMNLTQTELAERCELSLDMIGRIERAAIAPSLETIAKLADVLSVPPYVLFGGGYLADGTKMPREKNLQRISQILAKVDTQDLPWVENVLKALVQR